MNRSEQIMARLQAELGFSAPLVGGAKTILAQIDRFLARPDVPPDLDPIAHPACWGQLVSEVVVPETFFFRYPESFATLRDWASARGSHPLRALCVPCSTGEEAYSMAMTLREAGVPSFHIEATDASVRAVARARTGFYPVRGIRGLPEEAAKRWFRLRDNDLEVDDSLRTAITFRVANIFSLDVPEHGFDLIFCRNLLIYFEPENQKRIFERLAGWLRPGGILFLGPGEATTAASHGWKSTGHSMSFSFRHSEERSSLSRPPTRPTPRKIVPSPTPLPAAFRRTVSRVEPAAAPAPREDWLAEATSHSDAGRLNEATHALQHFHKDHEPTGASLLLQGIIEEARGDHDSAEATYRKALYLEPDQLDTLLHLSLLLENAGRAQAAVPLRRRIARLTAAS